MFNKIERLYVYYTISSSPSIINMPEHLRKTKKDNTRKNYELNGKYSARHARICFEQTKQNTGSLIENQNEEIDNTNKNKSKKFDKTNKTKKK